MNLLPTEGLFHLVRHERVPAFLELGWIVWADLGEVHGYWSVLMRWLCDCKVREPTG